MNRFETAMPRVAAFILDAMLLLPFAVFSRTLGFGAESVAAGFALAGIPAVLYFVGCHARYGRTLGKKIAELKVIDRNEQGSINFSQAVLRSLPLLVTVMYATVDSVGTMAVTPSSVCTTPSTMRNGAPTSVSFSCS